MTWDKDLGGTGLLAATWVMTSISIVAVSLRVISRTAFGRNMLGLDDLLTLFALAWNVAGAVCITLAVQVGLGQHVEYVFDTYSEAIYRSLILSSILVWGFSTPKFAIIVLLKRILSLSRRTYVSFWAVALINQAFILVSSVLWWFNCTPVQAAWDLNIHNAHCGSFKRMVVLTYITCIASALMDLFFALFPIPYIAKLNLSLRKRIAISASLGLGSLACVFSIYKITTITYFEENLKTDPTYAFVPVVLFTEIEANLLLITASLPTFGPIISYLTRRSKNHTTGTISTYTTKPTGTNHSTRRGTSTFRSPLRSPGMKNCIDQIDQIDYTHKIDKIDNALDPFDPFDRPFYRSKVTGSMTGSWTGSSTLSPLSPQESECSSNWGWNWTSSGSGSGGDGGGGGGGQYVRESV